MAGSARSRTPPTFGPLVFETMVACAAEPVDALQADGNFAMLAQLEQGVGRERSPAAPARQCASCTFPRGCRFDRRGHLRRAQPLFWPPLPLPLPLSAPRPWLAALVDAAVVCVVDPVVVEVPRTSAQNT